MVTGKNKHLTKGSKKGAKKKLSIVDPFYKTCGCVVKALINYVQCEQCWKNSSLKDSNWNASDDLMGSVFEVNLDEL